MTTHSINHIAGELEIDRQTLVRALRGVEPDAGGGSNRPTYKFSTAMNALMAHRARNPRADSRRQFNGGIDSNWEDPLLVHLYAQQDEADRAMRALPDLEARRKAAIAMIPLVIRVDQATRERGKANGGDAETVDMRADILFRMTLRGIQSPCQWSHEETWKAMSTET